MMRCRLVYWLCAITLSLSPGIPSIAAVPAARPYASPEVHADGTVTFRILAPKATEVTLEGGWMAAKQTVPLTRDANGLWSVTVGPLKPTVYAYWFNLDGAVVLDQANAFVRVRTGASSTSAVEVPAPAPLPWSMRDVPHGTIERRLLPSRVYAGETRDLEIYLPPGYADHPAARYPVLYLFHGAGETERSWVDSGKANLILDNLLANGRIKPMIVVMPNTGPAPAFASPGPPAAGVDVGPPLPVEATRYLNEEIMPWAQSHLRIMPGRGNRALAGLSAGGVLAAAMTFKDLDLTDQLGLFSSPIPSLSPNFTEVVAHPDAVNAKLRLLWIGVGRSDPGIADWLRHVDRELGALHVRHSFNETDGAHDYAVWRWCLTRFAPLLFRP